MKTLIHKAKDETQRQTVEYLLKARDLKGPKMMGVVKTLVEKINGSPAASQPQHFYQLLFNAYIKYVLKQCKVELGNLLAEQKPFAELRSVVASYAKDVEYLKEASLLNEGTANQLLSHYQQVNTFIDAREKGEKRLVSLAIPANASHIVPYAFSMPPSDFMFYLKDNAAIKYMKSQGATVEKNNDQIIIKTGAEPCNFEQDLRVKISTTKI